MLPACEYSFRFSSVHQLIQVVTFKIIALKMHGTEANKELKCLESDKIINDEQRSKIR
jgi:hypothetical protein